MLAGAGSEAGERGGGRGVRFVAADYHSSLRTESPLVRIVTRRGQVLAAKRRQSSEGLNTDQNSTLPMVMRNMDTKARLKLPKYSAESSARKVTPTIESGRQGQSKIRTFENPGSGGLEGAKQEGNCKPKESD